jgi:hypothetical protein
MSSIIGTLDKGTGYKKDFANVIKKLSEQYANIQALLQPLIDKIY